MLVPAILFTLVSSFIGITSCHDDNDEEDTISPLVKLHAILMIISWCILPAISIYLARFCKNNPQWFSIHAICGVCTVFGTILGLCSILAHLEWKIVGSEPHHLIGWLLLFIGAGLQPLLGWVAHKCWEPDRRMIPWIDRLHWHVGMAVWILALWNIHLGISMDKAEWSAAVPALFYIGLAAVASVFLFGDRSVETRPKTVPSNLKELGSEELTELVEDEPRLVFRESF